MAACRAIDDGSVVGFPFGGGGDCSLQRQRGMLQIVCPKKEHGFFHVDDVDGERGLSNNVEMVESRRAESMRTRILF